MCIRDMPIKWEDVSAAKMQDKATYEALGWDMSKVWDWSSSCLLYTSCSRCHGIDRLRQPGKFRTNEHSWCRLFERQQ